RSRRGVDRTRWQFARLQLLIVAARGVIAVSPGGSSVAMILEIDVIAIPSGIGPEAVADQIRRSRGQGRSRVVNLGIEVGQLHARWQFRQPVEIDVCIAA